MTLMRLIDHIHSPSYSHHCAVLQSSVWILFISLIFLNYVHVHEDKANKQTNKQEQTENPQVLIER